MEKTLREGFTTGTAAAAAAKAAVALLLGQAGTALVSVPLPPFTCSSEGVVAERQARLDIPLAAAERSGDSSHAFASVIKDGGDDPDATHGAVIIAHASLLPFFVEGVAPSPPGSFAALPVTSPPCPPPFASGFSPLVIHGLRNPVFLYAGEGVGRVTLPGLPVPPGEPAINPQPRLQIGAAVCEAAAHSGYTGPLHICISVPEGETRARHTLNGRLGITGGISILGTNGIVRPYSHEAWTATILQGMHVATALGLDTVLCSTGRRSERALFRRYPHLPPAAGIQAADFAAFSLRQAASLPFIRVVWGCFPGKLLKLAQGLEWTHAKTAPADLSLPARLCLEAGAPEALAHAVGQAPTAMGAFALMREYSLQVHDTVLARMAEQAFSVMLAWVRNARAEMPPPVASQELILHVFSLEGEHLLTLRHPPA